MDAVFLKLLSLSLSASFMVAAVLLLRFLLKGAPKAIHCVLWALVALRLLLPFSLESPFSLLPEKPTPSPESAVTETVPEVLTGVEIVDQRINAFLAHRFQTSSQPTPDLPAVPSPDSVPNAPAEGVTVLDIVTVVWLVGIVCMLGYTLFAYLRLRYRVRDSIPLEDNVRISDKISTPFILGFFRPRIYLPHNLSETDRAFVLAHERAHLKRRDHWWKPFGFALLAVYWFNPVLWVAYVLLCRDIEYACDEKVLSSLGAEAKRPYSRALINCSVPRGLIAACPLAFGEVGVKERVKSVLNYKKPAFWIILLSLLFCAVLAVCFLTSPTTPDGDPSVDQPTVTDTDTQTANTTDNTTDSTSSSGATGATDNTDFAVDWLLVSPIPSVPGGEALLEKYWILSFETVMKNYEDETGAASPVSFRDAEDDLTAEQLVRFFELATMKRNGTAYYQTWYNPETKLYHIPLLDIRLIIGTYFGFDCTEKLMQLPSYENGQTVISDPLYDKAANQIVLRHMGDFGGDGLFPVVAQVEKARDVVGLVVDYYDSAYTELLMTRVYIVSEATATKGLFCYTDVYTVEDQGYSEMTDKEAIANLLLNMVNTLSSETLVVRIEDTCTLETDQQRSASYTYVSKYDTHKLELLLHLETGKTRNEWGWVTKGGYYEQIGDSRQQQESSWWSGQGGNRLGGAKLGLETLRRMQRCAGLLRNADGTYTVTVTDQTALSVYVWADAMVSTAYNIWINEVKNVSFAADFDAKGNFVRYRISCDALGESNLVNEWIHEKTWGTCQTEVSVVTTDPKQIPDIVAPWGEFEGQTLTPEVEYDMTPQEALDLVKERGDDALTYRLLANSPVTLSGLKDEEYLILEIRSERSDAGPCIYEEVASRIYRVSPEKQTTVSTIVLSPEKAAQRVEELFKDFSGDLVYECKPIRLATTNVPYHRVVVRAVGVGAEEEFSDKYFVVHAYSGAVKQISEIDFY